MSEKEKKILDTFANDVLPHLSDLDKEKLLAFGEGLGFAVRPVDKTVVERPSA